MTQKLQNAFRLCEEFVQKYTDILNEILPMPEDENFESIGVRLELVKEKKIIIGTNLDLLSDKQFHKLTETHSHIVICFGYSDSHFIIKSWGNTYFVTNQCMIDICNYAFAPVTTQSIDAMQKMPFGYSETELAKILYTDTNKLNPDVGKNP